MNMIVSLMTAGAKKRFPREEYRRIREEANALFQELTEENKDLPKAMKKHTGTNIFPAIAVYKTLLTHGLTTDEATDVIRSFSIRSARSCSGRRRGTSTSQGTTTDIRPGW